MTLTTINTPTTRKADSMYLERILLEVREKYNFNNESEENINFIAQ